MSSGYGSLLDYIETEEPGLLDRVGSDPIKPAKDQKSRLIGALLTEQSEQQLVLTPQHAPELVEQDIDVVVHMGCHVIQTPHIIDATIDLLESFDLTIVPLGGFNNCCGSIDIRQGTFEAAEKVDDMRFNNIEAFNPDYLITECTSCFARTARFSAQYRDFEGYEFSSMIEFLHDRRDRLPALVESTEPVTVAFHDHFDPSLWTPVREAELARELFESIPGVETVELEHSLEDALPCNFLGDPAAYDCDDLTTRVYEEATAAGADVLINFWHACHRTIVPYDESYPVLTKNYATFLAERLGFSYRDKTKEYKVAALKGNDDWIIEDARAVFEANGLTETDARQIITDHLTPGDIDPAAVC